MVKYECSTCCKNFDHKGNFEKHINRLKPCTKINNVLANINKNNENINNCSWCNKQYVNKYSRLRHETTCVEKIKVDKEKLRIQLLEEKNKNLEDKLIELEQIIKQGGIPITQNTQNNNTNSHNTYNIQHIVVNKHGYEDMSHLTDTQKINNLSKGFNSLPEYIKLKHFDPAHPENSNIYMPSLKSADVIIFDGKNWIADDSNDVIYHLIDNSKSEVGDNFKELKSKLPPIVKELYEKVLKNDNEDIFKTQKKLVKKMLYNKKDLPIKIKKANKLLC